MYHLKLCNIFYLLRCKALPLLFQALAPLLSPVCPQHLFGHYKKSDTSLAMFSSLLQLPQFNCSWLLDSTKNVQVNRHLGLPSVHTHLLGFFFCCAVCMKHLYKARSQINVHLSGHPKTSSLQVILLIQWLWMLFICYQSFCVFCFGKHSTWMC